MEAFWNMLGLTRILERSFMQLSTCDLMCVEHEMEEAEFGTPFFLTLALQTPPVQGPTRKRKAKWSQIAR